MCVMSIIYDHYDKRIPQWPEPQPVFPAPLPTGTGQIDLSRFMVTQPLTRAELGELRQLIADFREAVAAAQKLDTLMQKPDCVDPAKCSLQERVAALEKHLNAMAAAATG